MLKRNMAVAVRPCATYAHVNIETGEITHVYPPDCTREDAEDGLNVSGSTIERVIRVRVALDE